MNDSTIFLTENRREVLAGQSDWSDASIANEKSRIRTRSRDALTELLEVAASPEIDNADVFNPVAVSTLLELLLTGDSSGLMPEGVPKHRPGKPSPEYASRLYEQIDAARMSYQYQRQQAEKQGRADHEEER